jgi:predicted 3-demethylubiquinone-9 3-methyltransferase (glyoxalase superfamily)
VSPITPYLWFTSEAQDAAEFYVGLFDDARVTSVSHYPPNAPGEEGAVMTVGFELRGQPFVALNGGPQYQFSPATSFLVTCDTQDDIDRFWSAFEQGGKPMQCGWVTDRFGVTWQVVPARLSDWLGGPDEAGRNRAVQAMLGMVKLDIAGLERAYAG